MFVILMVVLYRYADAAIFEKPLTASDRHTTHLLIMKVIITYGRELKLTAKCK